MTTVHSNNDLSVSGYCNINGQTVNNFKSSGVAKVISLVCANLFKASGHTKVRFSQLNKMMVSGFTKLIESTANEICSSGHFFASKCSKLGKVTGSGHTNLNHCHEIQEVTASGDFSMNDSKVEGNVTLAGYKANIASSTIKGELKCADRIVRISDSTIGKVIVKPIHDRFQVTIWSFDFFRPVVSSVKQVVELSGENTEVNSVSFEEGAVGKVYLKNGARPPVVTGAELIH